MKIKTTVTEIECNAEELRQSNSLSDAFVKTLRNVFNGVVVSDSDVEEVEEETNDRE